MRILSEKYNLPWKKKPLQVMFALGNHITKKSGVWCPYEVVRYRGRSTTIMTFTKDDDRRRLGRNKFSERQMERIRKAMELPEGTKPKWYEMHERDYEQPDQLESEDEEFPTPEK